MVKYQYLKDTDRRRCSYGYRRIINGNGFDNLQTKVGTAVLSKAMDTNEALGQGLVQMIDSAAMERSVTPELGANIDLRL